MAWRDLIGGVKNFCKWFRNLLFGRMSTFERYLIAVCIAIEVYIASHAIRVFKASEGVHGSIDGAVASNEINLMALGLIVVSLFVGLCVNVSAKFWTALFFVANLFFWCLAIEFGDGGGFLGFFRAIFH